MNAPYTTRIPTEEELTTLVETLGDTPCHAVFDKDGTMVAVALGYLSGTAEEIADILNKVAEIP